ncbi:MAG: hypothetical protein Q9163_002183 [Psora crenata]
MLSSVSGLGRLLNSASASLLSHSPKDQHQYDSVTEETVTYDLLYPEVEDSSHQRQTYSLKLGDPVSVAAAARSADDRGGLNVQASRDVRIIVAQHINEISRVLYDTRPPIPYSIRTGAANVAEINGRFKENSSGVVLEASTHSRKTYTRPHIPQLSQPQNPRPVLPPNVTSRAPTNESGGLFGSSRYRGNTAVPVASDGESAQGKVAREEREETDDLVNCIFGAPGFPSTSSTKIHVKRCRRQNSCISRPTSSETDHSDSPITFGPHRRNISRSNTEYLPSLPAGFPETMDHQASRLSNSYILISKLFSIDPNDLSRRQSINMQHEQRDGGRRSGPGRHHRSSQLVPAIEGNPNKHIRTPKFAVALVVYLPARSGACNTPTAKRTSSITDQSPRLSGSWSSDSGSKYGLLGREPDQSTEYVLSQWFPLIRTVANLEVITRCEIISLLAERYTSSIAQTRQTLQLESAVLEGCSVLREATEICSKRVALALRIRPVSNGQDRWTIWKGVARGIRNAAGGRVPDHSDHFLYNLLTAFLGRHREWLELVAPRSYRRQRLGQRDEDSGEVNAMRNRTVLVSHDKMAARRMIFLLSIFLLSASKELRPVSPYRHQTASFDEAYSVSPPFDGPMSRQKPSHGANTTYSSAVPIVESKGFCAPVLRDLVGQSSTSHARRASDAMSIRSIALPIASTGTRKSSVATIGAVVPQPQQVVPLFTTFSPEISLGTSAEARPGSSGSMAALRLQRTLSRSESNEYSNSSIDSQGRGRWSSARSGFGSSRRGSSTENSDILASSEEGLGISGVFRNAPTGGSVNKLSKMVEDLDLERKGREPPVLGDQTPQLPSEITSTFKPYQAYKVTPPKPVPAHSPPEPFPLTLSVNEEDGVIDVQYSPTASQSSSFRSTFTSPHRSRPTASSLKNRSTPRRATQAPKVAKTQHSDSTAKVAGWLRAFHPDFALQAVRPYNALKEDIKQSMRTEPTPSQKERPAHPPSIDSWTDVCTTLIADEATCSITRLTLQRKNAFSPHHQADALLGRKTAGNAEEQFVEEPILDHDPTLAEALERILSHSSNSSGAPSRTPSPPRSTPKTIEYATPTPGATRNECKRIILGALARVARSVAAEISEGEAQEKGIEVAHGRREPMPDNSLRQGVKRWMKEVRARSS